MLALVESERLVLSDPLNDVLILVESLTLVDVDALLMYLCLLSHSHLLMLTTNDVLALVESLTLLM